MRSRYVKSSLHWFISHGTKSEMVTVEATPTDFAQDEGTLTTCTHWLTGFAGP